MPGKAAGAVPWTTWALRVTAALYLSIPLGQSMLAGLFVTGDAALVAVHRINGEVFVAIALVQLLIAVLDLRARRQSGYPVTWRLIWLCGLALAVAAGQLGLGMARLVAAHITLGVTSAALGMFVFLAVLTETRPRPAQVADEVPAGEVR
ncbi:hypothetical protein MOQ72_36735 [Saccharopolyspora sp. K220]|uniref:hypothetical protein n=1 Tax=Saccharopolyspora soli TaxID=2926618 RepID=UPI001F5903B6|nr:hypothetical protein [Saccharopolyspora soli]MCI2422977.1 hypothetical protein [Saccharopolyspora soli]